MYVVERICNGPLDSAAGAFAALSSLIAVRNRNETQTGDGISQNRDAIPSPRAAEQGLLRGAPQTGTMCAPSLV